LLKDLMARERSPAAGMFASYITAIEFMKAVRIGRRKFDQLVQINKMKTIKKDRKVYLRVEKVDRYFKDSPTR